jgi:hypothetical protein
MMDSRYDRVPIGGKVKGPVIPPEENEEDRAKQDEQVRHAVDKVLEPKNWADDVIGRPIEGEEQLREQGPTKSSS